MTSVEVVRHTGSPDIARPVDRLCPSTCLNPPVESDCVECLYCAGIRIHVCSFRAMHGAVTRNYFRSWKERTGPSPSFTQSIMAANVRHARLPRAKYDGALHSVLDVIDDSSFMQERIVSTLPTEADAACDHRQTTTTTQLYVLIYCFRRVPYTHRHGCGLSMTLHQHYRPRTRFSPWSVK